MTTTHIGRYEVKDLLGEGGMGQVYRAVDPKLQQEVAIKVINPALLGGEKVLIRAQRELQVLLSLRSHPNIVTVYDYVEEPFALVMELLQGRSLGTVIAEHPSGLPVDQLYRHACSMVEAVGFAHEMGIFHRDIKPGNIMVVELGHQDQIKVLDFGLAGFFQDKAGLTRTGARMGTAGYIAPEQHLGEEVDERTDIYALGVILFEMATGQSPFQEHAHSDYELMKAQIERPMTVASLFRAELSRSLDEIILRATARYQQDRYTSCEELLEDLRKADHGGHVDYGLRGVHLSPSNSPVLGPVPTTPPPPEVNTDMFRAVTEEMLASRTPPPLPQTKENNQLQSIPTPFRGADTAFVTGEPRAKKKVRNFLVGIGVMMAMLVVVGLLVNKSDTYEPYPVEVRKGFLNGCIEEGLKTFSNLQANSLCECQLKKIEKRVKVGKFLKWSLAMESTGQMPDGFAALVMPVTLQCMEKLGIHSAGVSKVEGTATTSRLSQCEATCNTSCGRAGECKGLELNCGPHCATYCEERDGADLTEDEMQTCLSHIRSLSCEDISRLADDDISVLGSACDARSKCEALKLEATEADCIGNEPGSVRAHMDQSKNDACTKIITDAQKVGCEPCTWMGTCDYP